VFDNWGFTKWSGGVNILQDMITIKLSDLENYLKNQKLDAYIDDIQKGMLLARVLRGIQKLTDINPKWPWLLHEKIYLLDTSSSTRNPLSLACDLREMYQLAIEFELTMGSPHLSGDVRDCGFYCGRGNGFSSIQKYLDALWRMAVEYIITLSPKGAVFLYAT